MGRDLGLDGTDRAGWAGILSLGKGLEVRLDWAKSIEGVLEVVLELL